MWSSSMWFFLMAMLSTLGYLSVYEMGYINKTWLDKQARDHNNGRRGSWSCLKVAVRSGEESRGWGSATWTQAGTWSSPPGSPGRGCLSQDPKKHLMNPGYNTADVSRCIATCFLYFMPHRILIKTGAHLNNFFWVIFIQGCEWDMNEKQCQGITQDCQAIIASFTSAFL